MRCTDLDNNGSLVTTSCDSIKDSCKVRFGEVCIAFSFGVTDLLDSWRLLISARNTESFGDGIS